MKNKKFKKVLESVRAVLIMSDDFDGAYDLMESIDYQEYLSLNGSQRIDYDEVHSFISDCEDEHNKKIEGK